MPRAGVKSVKMRMLLWFLLLAQLSYYGFAIQIDKIATGNTALLQIPKWQFPSLQYVYETYGDPELCFNKCCNEDRLLLIADRQFCYQVPPAIEESVKKYVEEENSAGIRLELFSVTTGKLNKCPNVSLCFLVVSRITNKITEIKTSKLTHGRRVSDPQADTTTRRVTKIFSIHSQFLCYKCILYCQTCHQTNQQQAVEGRCYS
ncbi:hypothetical protein Ciccas_012545 [Cichlidogyrus casuarinus]|uniref:Uncharacterized protein n=1 Tax=Cichlidogyrus casuarinus TaxID=1844966 RepID=A0ABD2PT37_9PLAT